jgi:beta-lactamase regulating signal transducer with metallopeptidase domain/biopolymer transport protein ExbD
MLLEKQQMHRFKRFYLLGAFVCALVIPQFTITEYVEPMVQNFEVSNAIIPIETELFSQPAEEPSILTLGTVLWTIYALGVLLFSVRFSINLYSLYRSISKNSIYKDRNFIYVLLTEYRIPHSFFKYIFLNKTLFENNNIPKEVLLHEQTHAKQWHSLDILLLELLQMVFWFHPLVYILKHHVKLNHEFLADDAVLQQGVATKNYQNILLQFSSNTHNHQLASAINYSSFKKRFTVMKTQTSKTRIWLSILLVLPILAILFYSFAEREYVEKDQDLLDSIQQELDKANKLNVVYLDGATKEQVAEYNAWAKKINSAIKKAEANKSYEYPIIRQKEVEHYLNIYKNLMTDQQRKNAEAWPNIPPPPPPPPSVPEPQKTKKRKENTNDLFQTNKIQPIEIYIDSDNNIQFNGKNVEADNINKEVKKLNQHLSKEDHRTYVMASIAIEKNKSADFAKSIQSKLKEANVWSTCISYNEGITKSNLPKRSLNLYSGLTLEEAKEKQKKIFSKSEDTQKKIDSINNSNSPWKVKVETASYEFIDDNGNSTGKVNIEPTALNKQNELPVIYVNEKKLVKGYIALTKEELKKLKLTLSEGNVTNFKLKIPGIKTDVIQGNTISATSIKNLDNFDDGMITIFDIKDEKENRLPPIIIQLKK